MISCGGGGRFAGRKVLCVGSPRVVEVAREYGFSHAVGVKDVIRGDPNIYPLHAHRYTDTSPATPPEEAPSFAAVRAVECGCLTCRTPYVRAHVLDQVIVFHDPWEWGADLQIALDVLRGGSPLGSGSTQAVPFFHCNPDFVCTPAHPPLCCAPRCGVWLTSVRLSPDADRYGVPRLTCGAFTECLRHLFQVSTGHELETTYFSKPEPITFRYAERQLLDIARRLHPDDDTIQTAASEGAPPAHVFDRIFMVGDNPAADIKGANQAGHPWHSVLVRTGVFGGEEANHAEFPAHSVRPSLVEAVDEILSFQQQE